MVFNCVGCFMLQSANSIVGLQNLLFIKQFDIVCDFDQDSRGTKTWSTHYMCDSCFHINSQYKIMKSICMASYPYS